MTRLNFAGDSEPRNVYPTASGRGMPNSLRRPTVRILKKLTNSLRQLKRNYDTATDLLEKIRGTNAVVHHFETQNATLFGVAQVMRRLKEFERLRVEVDKSAGLINVTGAELAAFGSLKESLDRRLAGLDRRTESFVGASESLGASLAELRLSLASVCQEFEGQPDDTFRLYFNHIPKTGGTSLRLWLEEAFDPREINAILHQNPNNPVPVQSASIRFLQGHHGDSVPFREIPGMVAIAWLREPEAWLRSIYRYLTSRHKMLAELAATEPQTWSSEITPHISPTTTFSEFVELVAGPGKILHGYQCRWLVSRQPFDPGADRATDGMLASALRASKDYLIMGSLSAMQESVDLLCHRLKWPPVVFRNHHNRSKADDTEFPSGAMARFREGNPDFELFRAIDARVRDDFDRMRRELGVPGAAAGSDELHARMSGDFCRNGHHSRLIRARREVDAVAGKGWKPKFAWGEETKRNIRWAGPEPCAETFLPLVEGFDWEVSFPVLLNTTGFLNKTLSVSVNGHSLVFTVTKVKDAMFPTAEEVRFRVPTGVLVAGDRFACLRLEISEDGMRAAASELPEGQDLVTIAVDRIAFRPVLAANRA